MVSSTHHQIVICHSSEPPRFSSYTAPTDERVILLLFCDVFSGVRETSPPGSVQPEALLLSFVFLFVIVFSSDVLLHFPQQAQTEAVEVGGDGFRCIRNQQEPAVGTGVFRLNARSAFPPLKLHKLLSSQTTTSRSESLKWFINWSLQLCFSMSHICYQILTETHCGFEWNWLLSAAALKAFYLMIRILFLHLLVSRYGICVYMTHMTKQVCWHSSVTCIKMYGCNANTEAEWHHGVHASCAGLQGNINIVTHTVNTA